MSPFPRYAGRFGVVTCDSVGYSRDPTPQGEVSNIRACAGNARPQESPRPDRQSSRAHDTEVWVRPGCARQVHDATRGTRARYAAIRESVRLRDGSVERASWTPSSEFRTDACEHILSGHRFDPPALDVVNALAQLITPSLIELMLRGLGLFVIEYLKSTVNQRGEVTPFNASIAFSTSVRLMDMPPAYAGVVPCTREAFTATNTRQRRHRQREMIE